MKLFSLKNFTLSLNEAPKAHYFCFLLPIQNSAVQQKSNKATLPNTKTFSTVVKLALWVQSLCLLLHNNFLVFIISDSCWKVRIICGRCQITIPVSLEGFQACYSASAQSSTSRFSKIKRSGGIRRNCFPFEMTDKSLRVKLVIVSWLEHNLNQGISHFCSLNSTRKVNIGESFGSSTFKLDIALRNVRSRTGPSRCGAQCKIRARGPMQDLGAGSLWAVILWRHHVKSTVLRSW